MLSIQTRVCDRHLDEPFAFHPRVSNRELWCPSTPLVVRLKCGRHKGLISTWDAIHWLIVLYAPSGRCAFGMREIADEANVGRNQLSGPKGHIQRLVDLGLLSIVGYEPVPGVKEPRPIYHIDLAELERQSLELIPALLGERRLPPPPRPAPDPRQLALFGAEAYEAGTATPALTEELPASRQAMHENGTVTPAYRPSLPLPQPNRHGNEPSSHENGTVSRVCDELSALAGASMHQNGTVGVARGEHHALAETSTHQTGTVGLTCDELPGPIGASTHQNGTVATSEEAAKAPIGASMHQNGTDHALNRDVERKNEEKERESEITRARDFQQIVAATAQTVILVLQQQGIIPTATAAPAATAQTSLEVIPATPVGQPALRASVITLWQGDRPSLSPREQTQLALLADSYDATTSGFGAYWLGRAIMLADLCLSERGRSLSLSYVRKMLRRWAKEDSWGSDLPCEEAAEPSGRPQMRLPLTQAPDSAAPALHLTPVAAEATKTATSTQAAAVPVRGDAEHPAIIAYRAAFSRELNQVQVEEIAKTVTDLAAWQEVLRDWQANGWKENAVAKMVDRYRKEAGLPSSSTPSGTVSTLEIYQHPDLSDDERQRWLRRVSLASPVDKVQLLLQFRKEHPRD